MSAMKRRPHGNQGSAFVISILVLFMLTVLGLALMLTTSTEQSAHASTGNVTLSSIYSDLLRRRTLRVRGHGAYAVQDCSNCLVELDVSKRIARRIFFGSFLGAQTA